MFACAEQDFIPLRNSLLATYHTAYKVSPIALLVLFLVLIQGTSTTLTLVYHFSPALEALVSLAWAALYLISLVGLLRHFGINWITWLVRYRLLLVLLLMGVVFSAMWSIDAALTLERSAHLIGSTLIAFYIGFTIPLMRILTLSAVVMSTLMLFSVGAALALPDLGIENYEGTLVWRGIMTSKNTLGFWSAISVLLCAVVLGNMNSLAKKMLCFLGMLLALTALYFSVSATSVLAMVVAGLIMTYLFVAHRFNLGLISTLVLGVLCAALCAVAFLNINTAELIGRSGDLTGRGEVWSQTWKLVMLNPLTGYGYGTIWYPTDDTLWIQQSLTDFTWKVFHAHNGVLQLASEIGMPLTFLALLMIVQQLIEIVYCQYQRQQAGVLFVLGFTIALLVSNYSEARLVVNRELYWIFFVALPISMLQQVNVAATNTGFLPMPAPLHKRTRENQAENANSRKHRKQLKEKLKVRLEEKNRAATSDANIIEGDAKVIGSSSTKLVQRQIREQKRARRQKKTGS